VKRPVEAGGYPSDVLRRALARAVAETRSPQVVEEERKARIALELAEFRAAQAADLAPHLARCGLGRADAALVADGLDRYWGTKRGSSADALRVAEAWWKGPQRLLCLLGAPGTGKTMAAGWLMAQLKVTLFRSDWDAWVDEWPRTLSEAPIYLSAYFLARESFTDEARGEVDRLHRCRLLVVDELGLEQHITGPYLATLQSLLVRRSAEGLRTVLIANMSEAQLLERYGGARIGRRLEEDGAVASLGDVVLSTIRLVAHD
jgi:hypothetical protein